MDEHFKLESFYTSAPYSYRPSIAEFLTSWKISVDGIIADIMHLDKKKKLNIIRYSKDGFEIKLKNNEDLDHDELFLWNLIKSKSQNKVAKITFSDLDQMKPKYENQVVGKLRSKFNSIIPFDPTRNPFGYIAFGIFFNIFMIIATMIIAVPVTMLFVGFTISTLFYSGLTPVVYFLFILYILFLISLPLLIILAISMKKILNSGLEKKYLLKKVILMFIKLQLGTYLIYMLFAISMGLIFIFPPLVMFFPIIFFGGFFAYNHFYGKISYNFLSWLTESKEAQTHRQEWLKFKDFVVKNSEVEKKPYKYYELWEEFYYYTLAVGAIKNKKPAGKMSF